MWFRNRSSHFINPIGLVILIITVFIVVFSYSAKADLICYRAPTSCQTLSDGTIFCPAFIPANCTSFCGSQVPSCNEIPNSGIYCPEGSGNYCGNDSECSCSPPPTPTPTPTTCSNPTGNVGDVTSCSLTSGLNACDQTQTCTGSQTCQTNGSWGSCSGICNPPANPPGYGNACTSPANACRQTNTGTIGCNGTCSADTPANPPNYGTSCILDYDCPTGSPWFGQIGCNGTCQATSSPPACPTPSCVVYQGQPCNTNACGQGGTFLCSGSCSVLNIPPTPTPGPTCTSGVNACGQTQSITATCGFSCSVPPPPPTPTPLNCSSPTNSCGTSSTSTFFCTTSCPSQTPPPTPTPTTCSNACGQTNTAFCGSACNPPPNSQCPAGTADIKANGSDGPISIPYNSSATISWTSTSTTSCSVSPPNWTGTSGSQSTGNLVPSGTYTYTLNCSGPGGSSSDSVQVNVQAATLSVSPFTPSNTSGKAPLTISLTAGASGTAFGTINYTFWWDCTYTGTSVSTATSQCGNPDGVNGNSNGNKFNNTSNNPQTSVANKYKKIGSYVAKVIVERGEAPPAEARATIVVSTNPPIASSVTVTEPDYCTSGPAATVTWTYSDPNGDPESAYQVQIDDQASFASPEVDSGKVLSSGTSFFSGTGILQFNTTYQARVRVWDDQDAVSGWTEQTICNGPGCGNGGKNWKTPSHAYPQYVAFTWSPQKPGTGQPVSFSDHSVCYNNANNPTTCGSWSWTFGDSGASTLQNPTHTYSAPGTFTITEQVADQNRNACLTPAGSQILTIKRLFRWREVAPQ